MNDSLKKYLFEDGSVRVQVVRMQDSWREAQRHHDYPPAVRRLLGEMMAACSLLAANLKFDGALVMQMQGTGPIALLVVECHADLSLRATVKIRQDFAVPDTGTMQSLLNADGSGHFTVLLDPRSKLPGQQPYQGVVPIEGETVAQALEHYMKASEQLDTRLWLAADDHTCAGILIQRLPDHGGKAGMPIDGDAWQRAIHLASTVASPELLETDSDTLIHRIFWQETLTAFEPLDVRWNCPCSREKVGDMLRMLGSAEVEDILAEQGKVSVACDFCGTPYEFDPIDCAALFTQLPPVVDGESTVH